MNYIIKNNVIVIAQGVSKQSRKDQHPVKLQQSQSMPIHTSGLDHQLCVPKLKTTLLASNHHKEFDFTLSNNCGREEEEEAMLQLQLRNSVSSFHRTSSRLELLFPGSRSNELGGVESHVANLDRWRIEQHRFSCEFQTFLHERCCNC